MVWLLLIIAFTLTSLGVIFSYDNLLKNSKYYYPVGIIVSVITNLIWFKIARMVPNTTSLYKFGMVWDLMFALCWFAIPLLFFNVKLGIVGITGLIFMVIGVFLLNLGRLS